ncbi:MAG: rod-binding protein [Bacillota bacterium]
MKVGETGIYPAAGLPAALNDPVGSARDREFQKLLDKAGRAASTAPTEQGLKEDDKQLREVADQFEALFIYQMMQRMRSTVMKGGLFEESMGEQVFRGMLDQEYSVKMAEAGNLGLAEMVYEQLKRK